MTTPMTAAELYRHGLELLLEKDVAAWVDLWDTDGVLEFPFAPEGWPSRLDGKAAVGAYMRHYPDHVDLHDFPDVKIHQTTVPETIVVEMRGVGRLVKTDTPYDMTYIAVVTAEGGLITSYRDYWNPLAASQPGTDFAGANR
ncbi:MULTISPECIES: nuclear transport factor 2 family protein [Streptomyces]|uniref:nuclear transport factor 2 family protein n=1 Tax=Streptomyces TaxID=1883 RepID=UPI0006B0213E|nr:MULTISPECIES: nuclear transport factor 2 family protein [unclassified Streptomyces]KOU90503.1 phenazine biosynthesis protein PhzA/PhzB [Streptomyces sp. XY533]KOU96936.1 phenazine biosynthesis protein PhzA/PhzB [Streptomyces sp. XY511]RSS98901.1 nuclear transport factor 2 family protein [Streptomyces sp. WAC05950]